jgi:hypothetical protein
MSVHRFVPELPARLRRALGRHELVARRLERARSFVIRFSCPGDQAALERLAALDGRTPPKGSFLLAEIDGELVAAAPLDIDAEPVSDPLRSTANILELLRLQAGYARRPQTHSLVLPKQGGGLARHGVSRRSTRWA